MKNNIQIFTLLAFTAIVGISGASYQSIHAQVDFTSQEQTYLNNNPTIEVGSSIWPPYECLDSNNNLACVSGSMAAKFTEITGSTFTAHNTAAGDWGKTLSGLGDGTVDVAFMIENTGSSDTDRQGIAYTASWFPVPTHIIVKDTNPANVNENNWKTKKIVTVTDYAIETWLDNAGISYINVSSTYEALRGVENGTYDAHLENWEVAHRISIQSSVTGLTSVGEVGHTYQNAIGYTATNNVLGGILQKVLGSLDDAAIKEITDAGLMNQPFTTAEQIYLNNNPTIEVGSSIWPPYECLDSNGNLACVSGSMAAKFTEITGSTFTAHNTAAGNWGNTLSGLGDGTVDMAFMVGNTGSDDPDRQDIAYTTPWFPVPTHIIVKDTNPANVNENNWKTKKIVTVTDYAIETWLDNAGISYINVSSTYEALRGVENGTYDAHLENWEVAHRISIQSGVTGLTSVGEVGHTYQNAIGYTADNHVLGGILQKVLDRLDSDTRNQIIDAGLMNQPFTTAEQIYLNNNPTIEVGSSIWPPYECLDSNGNLACVSGSMAAKFTEITGSTFTAHSTAAGNWGNTLSGLGDGTVDMAFMVGNTGSDDPDRQDIAYTTPWFPVPTHIIVKDTNPANVNENNWKTKKIVTVTDYAIEEWLDNAGISYINVSSTYEALRGVENGTYDAHLENWEVAQSISTEFGITGLVNSGVTGHTYQNAIGYTADNHVLGGILQKVLDRLDTNELRGLVDRGLMNQPSTDSPRTCR